MPESTVIGYDAKGKETIDTLRQSIGSQLGKLGASDAVQRQVLPANLTNKPPRPA